MRLTMQVLEENHWLDVRTRANTVAGIVRVYRRMCREQSEPIICGLRIITVHASHYGRLMREGAERMIKTQSAAVNGENKKP